MKLNKICLASTSSLIVSFHSLLNDAALLLISFQDNGIKSDIVNHKDIQITLCLFEVVKTLSRL